MNALSWGRQRVHLAVCEHCGRRIAWSRRRRQWLALRPGPGGSQLARRMACTTRASGPPLHDPAPAPPHYGFWRSFTDSARRD